MLGEEKRPQEAEGLQSHQLSPSQPVLQASTYMSGMDEKDRNHLSTLVDTAIIKVTFTLQEHLKCLEPFNIKTCCFHNKEMKKPSPFKHIGLQCKGEGRLP